MASPLLRIGAFGVHVVCCTGIYSFTGDVPCDIKAGGYKSEQSAIAAFVQWFNDQDVEFRRAHAADLRNDVFGLVLTSEQL